MKLFSNFTGYYFITINNYSTDYLKTVFYTRYGTGGTVHETALSTMQEVNKLQELLDSFTKDANKGTSF